MAQINRERELYDQYLDAYAEQTVAFSELKAAELRHLQEGYDRETAEAERIPLFQAEKAAGQRYLEARKAYEDYRRARVESHK